MNWRKQGQKRVKIKAQSSKNKAQTISHREPKVNLNLGLCPLLLLSCVLFFLLCQAQATSQTPKQSKTISQINSKAKLSIGYDDNVSDRVKNAIKSRFLQLYINSDINTFPTSNTLFLMKIQDGLKYHDAKSLSNESILINNINFSLSHNILDRFMPEISGEVMSRIAIHSNGDISPSEESYLRGYTGLALKTIIFSDLSAKFFYNYKATNFEDFDPFDRRGHEFGLKTDVKLLPSSLMNIQYSREIMNFNKWDNGMAKRRDTTDIITTGIQLYKYLLMNVSASYENNRSNADGYSYNGYMLSVLMAKTISDNTVLELYTLYRSRKHDSTPNEPNSPQIDIEDEERNVVVLKVSRDINKHCALEVQYDLRKNRSGIDEGTYIKNVFSTSIVSDF
jgi:hypothetical protein